MRCLIACLMFVPVTPAFAQSDAPPAAAPASSDVVAAADDAFGRRIGIEQVGLYSEDQVRGFDLQSAGNYRIEDHYFVRAAGLPQALTEDIAIRVGANGLRTDFAAPSGVVQYALADAAPGMSGSIEVGWWGGSGPVAIGRLVLARADRSLGANGFVQLNPWQRYGDGTGGDYLAAGVVSRWRPGDGIRLTALVGHSWHKRGGDTAFATADGLPPPRIRRGVERTQKWMEPETRTDVAGLMLDADVGGGWHLAASAFRSDVVDPFGVFNLIHFPGGGAPAQNDAVLFADERSRSWSGEVRVERSFATGKARHRIVAMLRGRDSIARTGAGLPLALGAVADVDAPLRVARPALVFDPRRVHDDVRQWTAGLGYRLSLGTGIEIRADAQKTDYAKQVTALDGTVTHQSSRHWLYSASAAAGVTRKLTLFASYARGLEESGVAPGNAINRGEILPATLARQAELGAKYVFDGGPSLIAGLFDIQKPFPGLSATGVYGFVGEVRHRGVELSLAGPLTDRLSAVLGATYIDARISGPLVDGGAIGSRPIGRPEVIALANLTWQVPGIAGLALDGGVNFRGSRMANAANSATLPGHATVSAGLRQRFDLDGTSVSVRARVANLFNDYGWNAGGSGLFFPQGARTFTLTVTGEL